MSSNIKTIYTASIMDIPERLPTAGEMMRTMQNYHHHWQYFECSSSNSAMSANHHRKNYANNNNHNISSGSSSSNNVDRPKESSDASITIERALDDTLLQRQTTVVNGTQITLPSDLALSSESATPTLQSWSRTCNEAAVASTTAATPQARMSPLCVAATPTRPHSADTVTSHGLTPPHRSDVTAHRSTTLLVRSVNAAEQATSAAPSRATLLNVLAYWLSMQFEARQIGAADDDDDNDDDEDDNDHQRHDGAHARTSLRGAVTTQILFDTTFGYVPGFLRDLPALHRRLDDIYWATATEALDPNAALAALSSVHIGAAPEQVQRALERFVAAIGAAPLHAYLRSQPAWPALQRRYATLLDSRQSVSIDAMLQQMSMPAAFTLTAATRIGD